MSENLVYGLVAAVTYVDGQRVSVVVDEPWDADDPVVKARPDLFTPAPSKVNKSTVEKATQAPGEKRNTRRGKSGN